MTFEISTFILSLVVVCMYVCVISHILQKAKVAYMLYTQGHYL